MTMMKRALLLLVVSVSMSCSTTPTDSLGDYTPTLYLEGYLIAGRSVDSVYVGTTTPLLETFVREDVGLPASTVTLSVGQVDHALSSVGGGYFSNPDLIIEVGKTYVLEAETSLGVVTATTVVPLPPELASSSSSVSENLSTIDVTWQGATEAGYITTRKPVSLGESIPVSFQFGGRGGFGGGVIDTTGFGARRDSLAQAEQWRFLREASSTTIDYNSFTRFGSYTMLVYTLDSNYGDFLVSSQQDPRLLDEPRFSVQGGVGLLASMAADSIVYQVVDTEP
jgi:hypothetical protein